RLVFISLHLAKIEAFNADETRFGFAPRRMQISLAIEMRHARSHFVRSHLCNLARLSISWPFDKPPIRHFGFAGGLAVDSPARPVIVRSAGFGALIDVAEYAEMKVGILVKNRAFRIHVGDEVPGHKVPIGARFLGKLTNAFATGATGILEQRGSAIGGKLIQRVGHDHSPPISRKAISVDRQPCRDRDPTKPKSSIFAVVYYR